MVLGEFYNGVLCGVMSRGAARQDSTDDAINKTQGRLPPFPFSFRCIFVSSHTSPSKMYRPILSKSDILKEAKRTLRLEATAIFKIEERLNDNFALAAKLIFNSQGRVIITGIGKSGIIGRKIAATMSSTGTAAVFMHPTEAAHGDLGMIQKSDIVMALSKSGATAEINFILPALKKIGVPIIAMTGNLTSELALAATVVIDCGVPEEACPFDLAPTASTTAMLALGDALAIVLMKEKKFTETDFALNHPSGVLGKRLTMTVGEIMATGDRVPKVPPTATLPETVLEMTSKRFGATTIVNKQGKLLGIITDGDLRRFVQSGRSGIGLTAADVMTTSPKTIRETVLAKDCLTQMENFKISQMFIVDAHHKPIGILHLHDLVKLGL
jgi:arabinose-5-phosphate isomerase